MRIGFLLLLALGGLLPQSPVRVYALDPGAPLLVLPGASSADNATDDSPLDDTAGSRQHAPFTAQLPGARPSIADPPEVARAATLSSAPAILEEPRRAPRLVPRARTLRLDGRVAAFATVDPPPSDHA